MPAAVLYRPLKEDLSEVASGSLITTKVKVLEHKKPFSKKSPYRIICEGKNGFLDIVFFNYKKDFHIAYSSVRQNGHPYGCTGRTKRPV